MFYIIIFIFLQFHIKSFVKINMKTWSEFYDEISSQNLSVNEKRDHIHLKNSSKMTITICNLGKHVCVGQAKITSIVHYIE